MSMSMLPKVPEVDPPTASIPTLAGTEMRCGLQEHLWWRCQCQCFGGDCLAASAPDFAIAFQAGFEEIPRGNGSGMSLPSPEV